MTTSAGTRLDPYEILALLAIGEAAARRTMGYGDTHVGILCDTEALAELSCRLDATTAAGKS